MKRGYRSIIIAIFAIVLVCVACPTGMIKTYAAENTKSITVDGTKYVFGDRSKYDFTAADETSSTSNGGTYGTFEISGAITSETTTNGVPSYAVDGGTLTFTYKYSDSLLNAPDDKVHLVDDRSRNINDITLDSAISKGAIIVQTSKDGQIWYTIPNQTLTNVFADVPTNQNDPLYETTDIQLVNGCYYRVIIAYKTAIKTGTTQVFVIKSDEFEYHQIAEVYCFYAYDSSINMPTPSESNRKFLGSKVRTAKFEGYQGAQEMNNDDPHFGWDLGQFYVGGYTDCVKDENGNPVFLKNNGDKVSLWFDLLQDINKCYGNEKISVIADSKGSDAYFEVPGGVNETMDFGYGALIVRHITEDTKNKPQVYTDFLRATASVDADAKINLFEEGDYEVALDYAVKFDKTEVLGVSVLPQTAHYRIYFKFLVRNGNTIVFLFDNATGSELSNGAITPNGFRVDFANSRYLKVNVKKEVMKDGFEGLTEDTRFNSSVTDGEVFDEEGIYTITVTNQYTNAAPTVKRVYVGNNNVLKAYMVTGLSISEINDKVAMGATILDDGTILEPEPGTEEDSTGEADEDMTQKEKENNKASAGRKTSKKVDSSQDTVDDETKKKASPIILIVVITIIVVAAVYAYLKRDILKELLERKLEERNDEKGVENSLKEDNANTGDITEVGSDEEDSGQ